MNLEAVIAKMRAAGMTAEDIVKVIECVSAEIKPARKPERPNRNNAKMGAKARWGYEGPETPRLHELDWLPLRWQILKRDKFVCAYCGVSGREAARWCADHVVPLSRGGTNDPDNLVACCVPCNNSKCDRLLSEWKGRYR